MGKFYNLQRIKGAEIIDGELSLWSPPDIATGKVIPLTNTGAMYERSRHTVVFTSNTELDDFIDYFCAFADYSFKNATQQEMVFHYGSYIKTKGQKSVLHDGLSALHAKSSSGGLRSASAAISGEGMASQGARVGLDVIGDLNHFGISALSGPLLKKIGLFRTRYYVLVSIKSKYGQVAKVHNAQGNPKCFLNDAGAAVGSAGIQFSQIAIALRDFKASGKKVFGYGSVDLP